MAAARRRETYGVLDEETGEFKEKPQAPYAFDGPHINVGIRSARALASGDSGLTDKQFRVLIWYFTATEESEGPVMMTGAQVAEELKMSPDSLSRIVKALLKARMLVKAGGIGRTTFYRVHPNLAFIGSGFAHREAVKAWNPPEASMPEPKSRQRRKVKDNAGTEKGEAL
ncbi:MarR family transcriptional regulator [Streptomyces sp. NPDC087440]|uniref:MarR family transcriptional regulator n=1 Tax=Streptomyces sp. NPDC087440 TaxID=3365790 RepID=UPI00382DD890